MYVLIYSVMETERRKVGVFFNTTKDKDLSYYLRTATSHPFWFLFIIFFKENIDHWNIQTRKITEYRWSEKIDMIHPGYHYKKSLVGYKEALWDTISFFPYMYYTFMTYPYLGLTAFALKYPTMHKEDWKMQLNIKLSSCIYTHTITVV